MSGFWCFSASEVSFILLTPPSSNDHTAILVVFAVSISMFLPSASHSSVSICLDWHSCYLREYPCSSPGSLWYVCWCHFILFGTIVGSSCWLGSSLKCP